MICILRIMNKLILLLLLISFVLLAFEAWVYSAGIDKIHRQFETLPKRQYALILGTSPVVRYKNTMVRNLFYHYRLQAAKELWQKKKVEKWILSGTQEEAKSMCRDLQAFGVPASAILLDGFGWRTLDSIERLARTYPQEDIIIISQDFHLRRALLFARHFHLSAIGYCAKTPSLNVAVKTLLRERGARVKLFFDLIRKTQARYSSMDYPYQACEND